MRVAGELGDVALDETTLAPGEPVVCDVGLEAVHSGVLATGSVEAKWIGTCRRCLEPASGAIVASVQELFESEPRVGESYPLGPEQLDLEPMVREAVLLELPLAPLCRDDCAGLCPTCGASLSVETCSCSSEKRDPRWAALDALRENTTSE